jgi:BirA family biotin operon repressor/biotin-[acetyl-CoA-carboxylase] ligase
MIGPDWLMYKEGFFVNLVGMDIPGFTLIHLNEVDSTNTWVARRFDELDHHSLVYADVQLRGKGRGTRGWDSLIRGNLYMSLLVKDPSAVASRHAANFTQLIAVCARRAAAGFGADVGIKWPNDLFAGEGKIGGILSEARHGGAGLRGIIIGMGFNLTGAPRLAEDAAYPAVSLAELAEAVRVPSAESFLKSLIAEYTGLYPAFVARGFEAIADEYRGALRFADRPLYTEADDFEAEHHFEAISDSGELLLRRSSDGAPVRIIAGDVRWKP